MYDAGLFDPLDDDDDQVCTAPTFSVVSMPRCCLLTRIKSINVPLIFRHYIYLILILKNVLTVCFLDGQQFSDFMQEMLVMMDNVENEVGAQPHADFIS
jgi:hypothetical protein